MERSSPLAGVLCLMSHALRPLPGPFIRDKMSQRLEEACLAAQNYLCCTRDYVSRCETIVRSLMSSDCPGWAFSVFCLAFGGLCWLFYPWQGATMY